jgi:hypothetical protein
MRYLILDQGLPVGQWLIPAGTIIDAAATDMWSTLMLGRVPPPNAQALDQAAYDAMRLAYDYFRIRSGPGVVRRDYPGSP